MSGTLDRCAQRCSSSRVGRSRSRTSTSTEPRAGEVRVRILASGVCHSDLHLRDGEWPRPGPFVIGHEGAGVVEALGPGVEPASGLQPGRLVALELVRPVRALPGLPRPAASGSAPDRARAATGWPTEPPASSGATDRRSTRTAGSARWPRLVVVPASAAIPMPAGTPPEVAALIGCCVSTGVGAVTKTAQVPAGASVVVIGLGGVGLSAVMGAVLAGADPIVAVDRVPAKLELARAARCDRGRPGRSPTRPLTDAEIRARCRGRTRLHVRGDRPGVDDRPGDPAPAAGRYRRPRSG